MENKILERSHITRFYRLPQLKAYLNVSSSSIWAWVKAGTFPQPIKLSANTTAWNAADVEAWAQSRIAASQKSSDQNED
jgi:prophage regulatory protein